MFSASNFDDLLGRELLCHGWFKRRQQTFTVQVEFLQMTRFMSSNIDLSVQLANTHLRTSSS